MPPEQASRGPVGPGTARRWRPLAAVVFRWATSARTAVSPPQWSSGTARAHAVGVSVLTPAEILIAARRLAGPRPHLAAVAGIVHHEDLWRLCRDEHRRRRPDRWLGYPRPLVRRRRRGHAPARKAATRRDDPLAGDCRPDGTARSPRLTLSRCSPALTAGPARALGLTPRWRVSPPRCRHAARRRPARARICSPALPRRLPTTACARGAFSKTHMRHRIQVRMHVQ